MSKKKHTTEQIIHKLREAEVELAKGATVPAVSRKTEISEQTYHQCRKAFGGLRTGQAKRYKHLKHENARLRKMVADDEHRLTQRTVELATETSRYGDRRIATWLRWKGWGVTPILFVLLAFTALTSAAFARQPNVIVIFTDDQGSVDMNAYGATDLTTPSMDNLAERGVRFTQFYAAAPVCSPSRVGLMTGRTPQHGGLSGNVGIDSAGMPSAQVTIAEELKRAGYATAHFGKWHLGHSKQTMPNGQGFDHSFGHLAGCIDNYSHFFYWSGPNRHDLWRNGKEVFHNGEFFPDLMVEEAIQWMEMNKDNPFFIYFAMNTPHYPYQGSPQWLEHYKELAYPRNLYAAFLSTMDERIGRLLKNVDDLGLRTNTIVIFQSDHGHSTEVRAHGGGGNAGPYRGAKFTLYEGGLRIPAMISWPGHLPENQVRGQMATGCDWYPTILELCELPAGGHRIDGKSLVPIIRSETAPSAHQRFNWKSGESWAVREGKWKLVVTGDKTELYDIPSDPGETRNLAGENQDIVRHLRKASESYWKSFNADE